MLESTEEEILEVLKNLNKSPRSNSESILHLHSPWMINHTNFEFIVPSGNYTSIFLVTNIYLDQMSFQLYFMFSVLDMSSIITAVGAFGLKPRLIAHPRNVVSDNFELDAFPQLVFSSFRKLFWHSLNFFMT